MTITTVSIGAFWTGRIEGELEARRRRRTRSASVSTNAGQYGIRSISDQATNVVSIAISPCAKLITCVAR